MHNTESQKAKKLTLKQQTKYSECPFMAPELVSGRRAPSYQSDMFAFGTLLKSIDFKRKLPEDLKELLLRCTAVSVEDRPTSEELCVICYEYTQNTIATSNSVTMIAIKLM